MSDPTPKKRPIRDWVKKQAAVQTERREAAKKAGGGTYDHDKLRQPSVAAPVPSSTVGTPAKKVKTKTFNKTYTSPKLQSGGGCPTSGKGWSPSCKALGKNKRNSNTKGKPGR